MAQWKIFPNCRRVFLKSCVVCISQIKQALKTWNVRHLRRAGDESHKKYDFPAWKFLEKMAEPIFGKKDFFERLLSLMGGSLGDELNSHLAGRISTNNPPTITDHWCLKTKTRRRCFFFALKIFSVFYRRQINGRHRDKGPTHPATELHWHLCKKEGNSWCSKI